MNTTLTPAETLLGEAGGGQSRPGCRAISSDACVPISRLADCLLDSVNEADASGIPYFLVGHVGDGNFHFGYLTDPDKPEERATAEASNTRWSRALSLEDPRLEQYSTVTMFDPQPIYIQNGDVKYFGAVMPNISIKDVPERWAEALRQRAARNHRSLQGELMSLIELAVGEAPVGISRSIVGVQPAAVTSAVQVLGLDRFGHPITRRGSKTIEQIAAERRLRFPQPIRGGPLAVDIIREDRDSR